MKSIYKITTILIQNNITNPQHQHSTNFLSARTTGLLINLGCPGLALAVIGQGPVALVLACVSYLILALLSYSCARPFVFYNIPSPLNQTSALCLLPVAHWFLACLDPDFAFFPASPFHSIVAVYQLLNIKKHRIFYDYFTRKEKKNNYTYYCLVY